MIITPPKYGHGSGKSVNYRNFLRKKDFVYISYGGNLPHWYQEGKLQYITFRLNDSLPQTKLKELNEIINSWVKNHPKPWTLEEYQEYEDLFEEVEDWLDAGYGTCILKYASIQKVVEEAILYFDGLKYELFDYIIMPNHVHLLLIPSHLYSSGQILHSIKSYSSLRINKILNRKGKLWRKESFDRIIRSMSDYEDKRNYIMHNGDFL